MQILFYQFCVITIFLLTLSCSLECDTLKSGQFTGNLDELRKWGQKLFTCAASLSDVASLSFLLDEGFVLEKEFGSSTLLDAISKAQIEVVFWLLAHGVQVEAGHVTEAAASNHDPAGLLEVCIIKFRCNMFL